MRKVLFSIVIFAGGCTRYVELNHADARIWVRSDDMKEIYRCVDLVSVDGTGRHVVECIRARMRKSDSAGGEE